MREATNVKLDCSFVRSTFIADNGITNAIIRWLFADTIINYDETYFPPIIIHRYCERVFVCLETEQEQLSLMHSHVINSLTNTIIFIRLFRQSGEFNYNNNGHYNNRHFVSSSHRVISGEFNEILNITEIRLPTLASDGSTGDYTCKVCHNQGMPSNGEICVNSTVPVLGRREP